MRITIRRCIAAILVFGLAVVITAGRSARAGSLREAATAVRLVIGHRGSCADRPENTLASTRRAIEAGAHAIEMDVRTTRDGHLVIVHDSTLDRTTDGSGRVGEHTLAEIRQLDAGGWFDPEYRGERVPTLAELLALCRRHRVGALLDLKEQGEAYARAVTAVVREAGDPKRTIVGVRSPAQARLFRELLPESRQLGFIPRPEDIEAFAEAGVDMIRLWARWLEDESLVPRVREAGVELHLNARTGDIEEMRELLLHRPVAVLCDDPALLMEALAVLRSEGSR
jgi:glycerophosphoryl diester phosphodiesterase